MLGSIIPRDDIGHLAGSNWHIYVGNHMKEASQKSEAPIFIENMSYISLSFR
jgi:hypothetical protein